MPSYRGESAVAGGSSNSRSVGRETASARADEGFASAPSPGSGTTVSPILSAVAGSPFPGAGASDVRSNRRPAAADAPQAIPASVPASDYGKPGMGVSYTERKERFLAEKAAPATEGEEPLKGIEENREITGPSKRDPNLTEKVVEKTVRTRNLTRITRKIYERDARGALVGFTEAKIDIQFSYEATTETETQVKRDPNTLEEKVITKIVRIKQGGKVVSEDTTVTTLKKPTCPISKVQTIDPKTFRADKTVITTTYNATCQEVSTVKTNVPANAVAETKRAASSIAPSVSIKVPKRMPQALFGP